MPRFTSSAGQDHRTIIRIADGQWVELEQHDGGTPSVGWSGTYAFAHCKVDAVESATLCRLVYRVTLRAGSMRIKLLSDRPESPPTCGRVDSWPQRSLYETAVFHRVS
jgi:hypothetical protein